MVTNPAASRVAIELADLDPFDQLLERSEEASTREAQRLLQESRALVRGEVAEHEPQAS